MFTRLIQGLTGAKPKEQLSVLFSFSALLFLLLSYYLVKPLRDSLFFVYFDSTDQAYFSLPIILSSLLAVKTFNHFVGRIARYKLMVLTFGFVMLCKLIFLWLLPISGKWGLIVFYLWVSVYFTLVLSILWGVINSIFVSHQAERCFGFIALGSTLGNFIGSKLSAWLAHSVFKDIPLLIAMVGMAVSLGLIFLAVKFQEEKAETVSSVVQQAPPKKVMRGWQDILSLFQNTYVRGIAMMVYCLALITLAIQFQAYGQIDRQTSLKIYQQEFVWFDPDFKQFDRVYSFKKLNREQQEQAWSKLSDKPELPRLQASFVTYQKKIEQETRSVFSNVSAYQGVMGFILLLIARVLFRFIGLRYLVMALPLFLFVYASSLMFPIEIAMIQVFMIISGSLNYSLNNATKELLYTPTSEAVRFQSKPLIEGPLMRLGDLTTSFFQIVVIQASVLLLGLNAFDQGRLLLAISLIFACIWMVCIWQSASKYDRSQHLTSPMKELDLDA